MNELLGKVLGKVLEDPNVHVVTKNAKTYYFVGTNHVSKESKTLVSKVIQAVKPQTVCIELDQDRYENMIHKNMWENLDIVKVFKQRKAPLLLTQIILGAFQRKMAQSVNSEVGGEMVAAVEEANKINAEISLIDRNVNITFKKMWRTMKFREKIFFPMAFLEKIDDLDGKDDEEQIEEILNMDVLDGLFTNMQQRFPGIYNQMITERNQYLATKINESPGEIIVVVMGKAHVAGVLEILGKTYDLDELNRVPKGSVVGKLATYLIPALLIVLILIGFYQGYEQGTQALSMWLLWNAGLSALFTAVTLANPLTILTAFITAPLGTLSPLLSVGMFTGIVEATLKKPTVLDFQKISDDLFHFKKYFSNRALRVFLIFVMSSIGGLLGNFIAGLDLVRHLF